MEPTVHGTAPSIQLWQKCSVNRTRRPNLVDRILQDRPGACYRGVMGGQSHTLGSRGVGYATAPETVDRYDFKKCNAVPSCCAAIVNKLPVGQYRSACATSDITLVKVLGRSSLYS